MWRLALIGYAVALVVGTHLPQEAVDGDVMYYDKPIHAAAYFGLALLAAVNTRLAGWRITPVVVGAVLLAVLAFAAADELTQPLAGRCCDLADWLADAAGASAALAVGWWGDRRAPPDVVRQ